MRIIDVLTEAGYDIDHVYFNLLDEASQLQVTDDVLSEMMKFITDKYNALDFSEIEKSAGDINHFKYQRMIQENVNTLNSIYNNSPDSGAKKYLEVVQAIDNVMRHLQEYRNQYSVLYKAGNGVVQLMYTSLVASCLFATGVLVSNTIRFVTTERDTECEVLFDEIPGTIKHVHIKNVLAASNDLGSFAKVVTQLTERSAISESITATGIAVGVMITAGVIMLIPKILMLIREIIYSIYYNRVRLADMLELQTNLIRTNIESLEQGRGNRKVIARQRKIADKLEKWKNKVAVKMDTVSQLKNTAMKKENQSLRIDRDSAFAQTSYDPSDVLI